jgi:hypothetical protein
MDMTFAGMRVIPKDLDLFRTFQMTLISCVKSGAWNFVIEENNPSDHLASLLYRKSGQGDNLTFAFGKRDSKSEQDKRKMLHLIEIALNKIWESHINSCSWVLPLDLMRIVQTYFY